jgi:hypothetical protein
MYLLSGWQYRLCSPQVDKNLPRFDATYQAGEDFAFLTRIFLKYGTMLRFMESLEDNLFGSLGGDTPCITGGGFYFYGVTELRI